MQRAIRKLKVHQQMSTELAGVVEQQVVAESTCSQR